MQPQKPGKEQPWGCQLIHDGGTATAAAEAGGALQRAHTAYSASCSRTLDTESVSSSSSGLHECPTTEKHK